MAGIAAARRIAAANRKVIVAVDGKQWLAIGAIKEKHEALLARLGDGINLPAFPFNAQKHWRRRKVPVPKIVPYALKMPDVLARLGIERDQAVCKEVVAHSVRTVKIKRR